MRKSQDVKLSQPGFRKLQFCNLSIYVRAAYHSLHTGDNCWIRLFKALIYVTPLDHLLHTNSHLTELCVPSSAQQEYAMDLHKIIHSALHEFIQAYIPDADLR